MGRKELASPHCRETGGLHQAEGVQAIISAQEGEHLNVSLERPSAGFGVETPDTTRGQHGARYQQPGRPGGGI